MRLMELIGKTLFEYVDLDIGKYGSWVDTNKQKTYAVTNHISFVRMLFGITSSNPFEGDVYRLAYDHGWVRLLHSMGDNNLQIEGYSNDIKKMWKDFDINDLKQFKQLYIEVVEPDPAQDNMVQVKDHQFFLLLTAQGLRRANEYVKNL